MAWMTSKSQVSAAIEMADRKGERSLVCSYTRISAKRTDELQPHTNARMAFNSK